MKHPRIITSWDDVPVIMDIAYASKLLGLTYDCIQKNIKNGTFPGYKLGNHDVRINKDDLIAYIEEQKKKACSG